MSTPENASTTQIHDAKRARALKSISEDAPSRLGLFRRLYASPERVAPRAAIKAKCLECVWMDTKSIQECTATECPLWHFRPYQAK